MIELEFFYLTDEQFEAKENDEPVFMAECDSVTMCVLKIDCFCRYIDGDGLEYTSVWISGNEWVCMLSYEDLKEVLFKTVR
jgi:hypothetical protein